MAERGQEIVGDYSPLRIWGRRLVPVTDHDKRAKVRATSRRYQAEQLSDPACRAAHNKAMRERHADLMRSDPFYRERRKAYSKAAWMRAKQPSET